MNEIEYTGPKDESWDAQQDWAKELQAAHREVQDLHQRGDKILELYNDDRKLRRTKRFPLFNANVSILENALFARIPRPDVSRRFKDPDDHIGRVASLIVQRALSTELEGNSHFRTMAKSTIKDMLVVGLGAGWVRYEADIEQVEDPQITDDENDPLADRPDASPVIKDQRTPIDYVHWKDLRWSPCRTWNEARWVARRVYMDEVEAKERFGEKADYLAFNTNPHRDQNSDGRNESENMVEPQAEIWEIWDKTSKKVYWICESCPVALDIKDDFLGLPDFFPTDRPLVANISTSKFMPSADYTQLQDQYNDLNETNNRISRLVKACRLAGVYDDTQPGVKLVLEGAAEHQLVPVKNWNAFQEKGGLKGAIDFVPLTEIAAVIDKLTQHREALKQQIYELTGISDIVRGASNPYETAAAQGMKAQYASIRLQGKQADVAEYLTSLIQRKAFLMLKYYEPQRLMERCGTLPQADQQYVPAAMQLLQNELMASLKLEISTDSLQQPNWAKDQAEKSQTITALGQLMAQAIPATKEVPQLGPLFLHLIKWAISGNPGAREVEGVIEMGLQQVLGASQQPQQQEGPSPEQQAAEAQAQVAAQKAMADAQLAASKVQADQALAQQKLQFEADKAQAELDLKREMAAKELELKREVEMMKASQKPVPQVQTGIDEEQLVMLLTELQKNTVSAITSSTENTIAAITALANQPVEPAQVVVRRNEAGDLVGVIQ